LAVGTPEELRQSLWRRRTAFQLERVNKVIVAAVKRVCPRDIKVVGNKLVVDVSNPEKENPDIVDAIGRWGGRVQFVTEVSPTLEDVYLKLVRS
jgi:hypothetical protein